MKKGRFNVNAKNLRRRSKKLLLLVLFIPLLIVLPASAPVGLGRTVGVLVNTGAAYEGYTLFSPMNTPSVYLIDNEGRIIHFWEIEDNAGVLEAHLLDNGHLVVVTAPRRNKPSHLNHGAIRKYTWDNAFVWEYYFDGTQTHQHHGIDILPNGNILAIAWNRRTADEAAAMGLKPAFSAILKNRSLLVEIIVEIDPFANEVVWRWDPWDHLAQDFDVDLPNYGEIAQRPQRIDINYQPRMLSESMRLIRDWMHTNAVHYHPELDQIVISVREFNEFWIIDRSASTTEAAGPAGDLLWRWGNPAAYQRGDPVDDRQLFLQYDVQWIEDGLPGAGNILIFNNQNIGADGEKYSSILELNPPLRPDGSYDWEQDVEIVWSYRADGFHSPGSPGVQRLPNGNTLITEGRHGRLIEVSADGEAVWEFVNPVTAGGLTKQGDPPKNQGIEFSQRNALFRVHKYPLDHPAFAGRDMTPGDRLVD